MCGTCGCDGHQPERLFAGGNVFQAKDKMPRRILSPELNVLSRNDEMAAHNRAIFLQKNILTLNLVSSPGSGKTTLLEKTILILKNKFPVYVIEGDQQTNLDAERIRATGVPAVQINTGKGCHLDAEMIHHAVHTLNPDADSILMIENVGNLVCPALFNLGEKLRVVIISLTEGEDKPLKYPNMFESSHICIINKTDLRPYLNADLETLKSNALKVNHRLRFFELSAATGAGLDEWISFLCTEFLIVK